MANKRMFSKDIIDNDEFYDLPLMSQLLYFHLGMNADVKGFVQPKKVIRVVGLRNEDLKPLIEKNFVILFENGVVIITHWNINNTPRDDRESPSLYIDKLSQLKLQDRRYVLIQENSRSSPGELRGSIVEYSRVESSIEDNKTLKRDKIPFNKINFIKNKDKILEEAKALYPNKDCDKVLQDFLEGIEIKNYGYKNYKLAYFKWVRNNKQRDTIAQGGLRYIK